MHAVRTRDLHGSAVALHDHVVARWIRGVASLPPSPARARAEPRITRAHHALPCIPRAPAPAGIAPALRPPQINPLHHGRKEEPNSQAMQTVPSAPANADRPHAPHGSELRSYSTTYSSTHSLTLTSQKGESP